MNKLIDALRAGRTFLMDGAMGTQLQRRSAERAERLNWADPAAVRSVLRAYLDAGADVLLTNTFQANPLTIADRHEELWQAAIELARVPDRKPAVVLADVGPIENLTREIARAIWRASNGADGLLLETWTSLLGLREFADSRGDSEVPLLVSFTFTRSTDGLPRTLDGASAEECARVAYDVGAIAVGTNCGKEIGMWEMGEIVRRYQDACDLPVFARPNAGTPTRGPEGWDYPRTPSEMAKALPALLSEGIAMIGGCCGTTPGHIRAFREVIEAWNERHAS